MPKLESFILQNFPLKSQDSSFTVNVTVASKSNRVNINNLYSNKKSNLIIIAFLKNLLIKHKLVNPELFISLLLDTMDEDLLERANESEIAMYDMDFKNGKIENSRHFVKLINKYISLTDDKNINNIAWEKLLVFGKDAHLKSIDCDYMSKELVVALGLLFDKEQVISCQNLHREINSEILKKYKIGKYQNKDDYLAEVTVSFAVDKRYQNMIRFDYGLKSGRVEYVEKYF